MAKLLDVRRMVSSEEDVPCVLCLSEKIRDDPARAATTYCVDCRQNYCEHCIGTHDVIGPLVSHTVVERGKPVNDLVLSSSLDRCDTHTDRSPDVYCKVCRKPMCLLCSVEPPHHSHDRVQLETVVESLRNGIRKDVGAVSAAGVACQTVRGNLRKLAGEFSQHVERIRATVEGVVDQLRQRVDADDEKMASWLARVRENGRGRFLRDRHEVEHHLSALTILNKYLVVVRENGTSCDVACLARPLQDRATELRKFDVTRRIKLASHSMVVSFVPGFGHRQTGNMIGSLEEKTVDKGMQLYILTYIHIVSF